MGARVLLVTMDMRLMASMSCNPVMGGIAKGQIVREIDAMGGYSGIVSDRTMIQFRMLNKSKGPAMWSPRCQSDKMMFSAEWRSMLEKTPNVDFWQDTVTGLLVKGDQIKGVKTLMGGDIESKAVILTNGTFLNGLIHIGEQNFAAHISCCRRCLTSCVTSSYNDNIIRFEVHFLSVFHGKQCV